MGFENRLNTAHSPANDDTDEKAPLKLAAEQIEAGESPFRDGRGQETPLSAEGVLNRQFGKDPSIPSQAAMYEGGILNRSKMYENRTPHVAAQASTEGEPAIHEASLARVRVRLGLSENAQSPLTESHRETAEVGMRDLFLEQVTENKQNMIPNPAFVAFTSISEQLQNDPELSEEDRGRKTADLDLVFSSYQRNVRENES